MIKSTTAVGVALWPSVRGTEAVKLRLTYRLAGTPWMEIDGCIDSWTWCGCQWHVSGLYIQTAKRATRD